MKTSTGPASMQGERTFPYILKMIRPFYWHVAFMFALGVVWSIDVSLRPYLLKVMLNRLELTTPTAVFESLTFLCVAYVAASFVMITMFRLWDQIVQVNMVPAMRRNIINGMFSHLIKHSHSYYQNNFPGSLTNKINDLATHTPDVVTIAIDRFFSHTLALTVAIYTVSKVSTVFALILFGWVALFFAVTLGTLRYVEGLADAWSELGSTFTGRSVDVLSNMLSVRLFARHARERSSVDELLGNTVKAERKLQRAYFFIWCSYGYGIVLMQAFNLYFLMKGYQSGSVTVGDFALVLVINISIVDFLWQLGRDFTTVSKALGKISQALRLTTTPIEIVDAPNAKDLVVTRGEIVFDQVHFQYKGANALFNDKSIAIPAGQKVGLVGYSGSGKTTFVNLILRLHDIKSGRILIDEQDTRFVTQDSLRQAVAMIPQDPSLFHRTLFENIRYGRDEASDADVVEAAKRAHAHDFIALLPQGYGSMVGERGIKLSGGQRQRIAIARAILKNAPILILDEATSQLDSVVEGHIQDSLWQLMQGKTTLVIAHRLSTLLRMDRILVFERGKIIEDGTHAELLARGGRYATLWDAQVGGFLPDRATNVAGQDAAN